MGRAWDGRFLCVHPHGAGHVSNGTQGRKLVEGCYLSKCCFTQVMRINSFMISIEQYYICLGTSDLEKKGISGLSYTQLLVPQ